ncbi:MULTISPECIES: NADPH-dependent FMN reductase [Comamonas]|uniref:NADPH-dependent FMN reductase n=1 Tax=Comamonas thiooxydans TaxID=363952 RepID=A0A0E3BW02_9BURK|nr:MULTISPECIES: NADPH-dependent FMN reductase [Comamonas]KGG87430.1 NADPH-dependent FMN reductase [Comamonas thiooxydans]KGH10427.1 NADPH-dependent FMN reductase [Comamonas thiooxydans]KGH18181.1 NADPH-dependent FMN reductase [Comamonas thiooxydans]KGH22386.1 NADPH-dependent FMN reductase [Comamonas thiooxydans]GAO70491.1 FMN reductase [Comamonas sp. E6]
MSILLIAGSPSQPSRSSALLNAVAARLQAQGLSTEPVLQLNQLDPAALLHARFDHSEIRAVTDRVARADAVVVATPVYKAAYSGLLKVFLDVLPQTALKGKLVLPLATGGSPHHMLALDYALRPVLQSLGARHILPGIYATDQGVPLLPEGGYGLAPEIAERVEDAAQLLATDLRRSAQWAAANDFESIAFADVRCSV